MDRREEQKGDARDEQSGTEEAVCTSRGLMAL